MKKFWGLFTSLKLSLWLTSAILVLFLYGAIVMPREEIFMGMSEGPLFKWLIDTPVVFTWWLWASIFILVFLTLNTFICSIDSIIKKKNAFVLLIAPQVIHIGFLFILLAHLLSSLGGYKLSGPVPEGMAVKLPNGQVFRVFDLNARPSPEGYILDWDASIMFISEGKPVKTEKLSPNKPAFFGGLGYYLKEIRFEPSPVALMEVSREPGAPWALAGGIFFSLGTVALVILKIRQE